jgi:hypothetical protein
MLILKIITGLVLASLITWVLVFVHLYLLSKFLDWLDIHYGTKMRRLLKQSPKQRGKDSGYERSKPEYLVYLHYTSQYASVGFKRISDAFHVHINPISNSCENQYSNARPKGFIPRRPFHSWRTLPQSHIRTIVNWLRRRVNRSGKEPIASFTFCMAAAKVNCFVNLDVTG